jgi:hypothetical protein
MTSDIRSPTLRRRGQRHALEQLMSFLFGQRRDDAKLERGRQEAKTALARELEATERRRATRLSAGPGGRARMPSRDTRSWLWLRVDGSHHRQG